MKSRIGLSTFDFYRENREIFDKHKLDDWWWLSTPNGENYYVVCVAPSGCVYYGNCDCNRGGVRPVLLFSSSIFVSRDV